MSLFPLPFSFFSKFNSHRERREIWDEVPPPPPPPRSSKEDAEKTTSTPEETQADKNEALLKELREKLQDKRNEALSKLAYDCIANDGEISVRGRVNELKRLTEAIRSALPEGVDKHEFDSIIPKTPEEMLSFLVMGIQVLSTGQLGEAMRHAGRREQMKKDRKKVERLLSGSRMPSGPITTRWDPIDKCMVKLVKNNNDKWIIASEESIDTIRARCKDRELALLRAKEAKKLASRASGIVVRDWHKGRANYEYNVNASLMREKYGISSPSGVLEARENLHQARQAEATHRGDHIPRTRVEYNTASGRTEAVDYSSDYRKTVGRPIDDEESTLTVQDKLLSAQARRSYNFIVQFIKDVNNGENGRGKLKNDRVYKQLIKQVLDYQDLYDSTSCKDAMTRNRAYITIAQQLKKLETKRNSEEAVKKEEKENKKFWKKDLSRKNKKQFEEKHLLGNPDEAIKSKELGEKVTNIIITPKGKQAFHISIDPFKHTINIPPRNSDEAKAIRKYKIALDINGYPSNCKIHFGEVGEYYVVIEQYSGTQVNKKFEVKKKKKKKT